MRRLRTYAPSMIPWRCGGLSLVRRLRISASAFYFIFLCSNRQIIFYAQAADIRALSVALLMLYRLFWDLLVSLLALLGYPGLSCALLGSSGLSWARLGSPGLSKALLGSPGLPGLSWALSWLVRALLGSPVLFWARLGSPGLVWALLGSLGLVWALLGSPGFIRASLGSSGFF